MKGKLFVIESGIDASGKATQSEKIYERLLNEGKKVKKITFPSYESRSSALVKMYLNGEFGNKPNDVNPYTASTFYAVDRFASYVTQWKDFLQTGGIIITDRYTTSNMVHQASKFDSEEEKKLFLAWLWDLEFTKMALPVPDSVIFLNMDPKVSLKLMEKRLNKITGEMKKDIHERDTEYLKKTYKNALWIADVYNWEKIHCIKNNQLKTIDEIHEEIYEFIKEKL
ncbi:dTMP kinase [Marinisporobacter balticus]|uniref:Thymidylate kinase n=1 Tax=Marinisporobacter balticus TaxID=2018667 RepID=A0A4R2KXG5_9FIRM|nr:thymidylate kinase [Marinisporobacter balticus]TCO78623.1 dTMP kinase [Marinisporobacter balticus]